jgi:CBS domain containing-hemolysin-like protein
VDTDELQLLVEHSARAGHIDTTENELLQSIVALPEASVREVMTPRVDIEFVRSSDDSRRIQHAVRSSSRRILPVCGRDLDDVRGLLVARDALLNPGAALGTLLRPPRYVPEQVNLAQLVRHFHEEKTHFAIVVDEYGGTSGLVTVDDVVEWIVGDLPESAPAGAEAAMEQIDPDTYRLSGDVSVRDWAERFGVEEIDRHVDTLAGLILSKLGRLPRPGDSVRLRNLTLTVESVRRRRIDRVLIRRQREQQLAETSP